MNFIRNFVLNTFYIESIFRQNMHFLESDALCHFASPMGNGWALSEYEWSCEQPKNEFTKLEKDWIKKALANTGDNNIRSLANYALLLMPSGNDGNKTLWAFGSKYDYNSRTTYYYIDSPSPDQLKALSFVKTNWTQAPTLLRKCDVLRDYMADRFIAKPRSNW